jgi:ribosome-binding protein aMBF1 (putative translation factor)
MARKILTWEQVKQKMLTRTGFKEALARHRVEYDVAKAIIEARTEKGISQHELAKRMKTTQSAISRLERGNISPSVFYLHRLAKALDSQLRISFGPRSTAGA